MCTSVCNLCCPIKVILLTHRKTCYSKTALEIPERIGANCFSGLRTALHPWSRAEGHSDKENTASIHSTRYPIFSINSTLCARFKSFQIVKCNIVVT